MSDLRGRGAAVSNLVSWGALLNWGLIAGGCWLLVDFSVEMALLFAALETPTGNDGYVKSHKNVIFALADPFAIVAVSYNQRLKE